jgi:hypothetical protein
VIILMALGLQMLMAVFGVHLNKVPL